MNLSGIARKDFQQWMCLQDVKNISVQGDFDCLYIGGVKFYDLPVFIQMSSYTKWFETVGIYVGRVDVNYWWIATDRKEYFKSGVGLVDKRMRRQAHVLDFAQRIYKGTAGI